MNFQAYLEKTGEIGFVEKSFPSLVYAHGLPGARLHEMALFENGTPAQVLSLGQEEVELLSFGKFPIRVGTKVTRTGHTLQIPVGAGLLGAVVNPLGVVMSTGKESDHSQKYLPLETVPKGIKERSRITKQCETGISFIDLMMPIGKGQRELVLGDQNTGKSHLVIRTLLTQIKQGSIGIYAAVGKSQTQIKDMQEWVSKMKIQDRVVLVVSSADDPAGMIFLTPYAAMTIAEYFRDAGNDVFLMIDDLTVHAKIYREISLLGGRFPGRNSYPGDIFYAHARLLERAGNFKTSHGEKSITCLPIIETVQSDITGYIQTNAMAMTDGHILFDHNLFTAGRRPAIDPFISVTRVGRQTQTLLKQEIGRALLTFLKNMERLHRFSSFATELYHQAKQDFAKEERIFQYFDYTESDLIPGNLQVLLFGMIWGEFWTEKTKDEVRILIQKTIATHNRDDGVRKFVDEIVGTCDSINTLMTRMKNFNVAEKIK